jgi:hypothetical protein
VDDDELEAVDSVAVGDEAEAEEGLNMDGEKLPDLVKVNALAVPTCNSLLKPARSTTECTELLEVGVVTSAKLISPSESEDKVDADSNDEDAEDDNDDDINEDDETGDRAAVDDADADAGADNVGADDCAEAEVEADGDIACAAAAEPRRNKVEFHLFLIALSVRPGTFNAICAHLFPQTACAATIASSSSFVHASFFILGFK